MTFSLKQLAELTESHISGDKNIQIDSAATLEEASNRQISFVSNAKYISKLTDTNASAVILNSALAKTYSGNALINDDPYLTFARVLAILHPEAEVIPSIHKSAMVAESAKIHESSTIDANVVIESDVIIDANVYIGAGAYIGKGSKLSSGVRVYPNVTLYNETHIGENSIIHANVVIGADGFGFAPTAEKKWVKIPQIGNVIIGKNVEIGASTTIDRATLGATIISDGVKLDNQIHIGHNVNIDEHTVIAAGTLVAGSTSIGKRCQIGGAVAISGHLSIADDTIITGRTMVMKSLKTAGVYSSGVAADENKKWRKNAARFRSLDSLAKKVAELDKKLSDKK